MMLLIFLFFPFLLFASLECDPPYDKKARFLPVEEIVKSKLLKKDLFISENLVLPDWLEQALEAEFASFGSYCIEDLNEPFSKEFSSCAHFRIRKGKLQVKVPAFFVSKSQHPKIETICIAIYRLMHAKGLKLNDGDFLIYMKDGADEISATYPILCFSKNRDSRCVLIPDWFSLSREKQCNDQYTLKSIFQQKGDVIREIMQGNLAYPWHVKSEIAFWRGGAHGNYLASNALWKTNPRSALILFSLDHPDLVFARFLDNRFSGVCDEMIKLKPKLSAPWKSTMESCLYKYQIDVDGWASGYHRCQWVLRSNCVPLKQESSYVQWYYSGLKPYVHYVPYLSDCSDLAEKINWLKENDDIAYEIACAGQQFAEEYLSEEMTHLYLYEVLKRVLEKCSLQTENQVCS